MVFKHFDWLSDYSQSEALFTSSLFSTWLPKIVLYLIILMELKDY